MITARSRLGAALADVGLDAHSLGWQTDASRAAGWLEAEGLTEAAAALIRCRSLDEFRSRVAQLAEQVEDLPDCSRRHAMAAELFASVHVLAAHDVTKVWRTDGSRTAVLLCQDCDTHHELGAQP